MRRGSNRKLVTEYKCLVYYSQNKNVNAATSLGNAGTLNQHKKKVEQQEVRMVLKTISFTMTMLVRFSHLSSSNNAKHLILCLHYFVTKEKVMENLDFDSIVIPFPYKFTINERTIAAHIPVLAQLTLNHQIIRIIWHFTFAVPSKKNIKYQSLTKN